MVYKRLTAAVAHLAVFPMFKDMNKSFMKVQKIIKTSYILLKNPLKVLYLVRKNSYIFLKNQVFFLYLVKAWGPI